MPSTYDQVRQMALALPGVSERRAYGGPSLHVGRKFLGRLREDGETLVLKVAPAERDSLLEGTPDAFFLTDHYRLHPYVLVNLHAVDSWKLRRLVEQPWRITASKRAISLYEKARDPRAPNKAPEPTSLTFGKRPNRKENMSVIFEKLNVKGQSEILVINPPPSFEAELIGLEGVTVVRDPKKTKAVHFALVFATKQVEVDELSKTLASKAEGDAVLWFAYPKGTSKKYECEFNRDSGWNTIRGLGFDSVRQIAIDEDWSALRFRRVEHIKSAGKSRTRP